MTASESALRLTELRAPQVDLFTALVSDVRHHRGGQAILDGWASLGVRTSEDACRAGWWFSRPGHEGCCVALVHARCVNALYVAHPLRRKGHGRSLLEALLRLDDPPRDGWALPGDRAMKSLYEEMGWKARLLTMRGA